MSAVELVALIVLAWFALALFLGLTLSVWIRRINRYSPEPSELLHQRHDRRRQAA
jgi:hypothetical protein